MHIDTTVTVTSNANINIQTYKHVYVYNALTVPQIAEISKDTF